MKNLSILITAILLSYSVIAQDFKFEIGLQGGPNLTTMRFESFSMQSTIQPRFAGTAGLFVQYNFNNIFSLRADPSFERLANNSGKISFTDQSGNSIGTGIIHYHYDYFTLPILFRASTGNQIKFFVNAGPSLSILLNQKFIAESPIGTKSQNNTSYFETLNFGITGGVGVALPIKENFSLSFEIRDNFGLTNINTSTNTNNAIRTNATSLLVGFAYKLAKPSAKATFTPTF